MASDIDKLNAFLADAEKAKQLQEQREREDHQKAVDTVKKMIEMYHIKPEELGLLAPPPEGKRISKNGTIDTRHLVRAKYRGPNGEEWAGRGEPPKWMRPLLAKGARKEDFLITSSDIPEIAPAQQEARMREAQTDAARLAEKSRDIQPHRDPMIEAMYGTK